jgi:hypothetical protein
MYYINDYYDAERAIPVEHLAWTKPLFTPEGDLRLLPAGSTIVASSSNGDYPVSRGIRNDAHMRLRRNTTEAGGKIVKLHAVRFERSASEAAYQGGGSMMTYKKVMVVTIMRVAGSATSAMRKPQIRKRVRNDEA